MSNSSLNGWQASLEYDQAVCATREQADAAAQLLGWTVEEEIAAEHGLWMVTITQTVLDQLLQAGYIEIMVDSASISPQTCRFHCARGEIELP